MLSITFGEMLPALSGGSSENDGMMEWMVVAGRVAGCWKPFKTEVLKVK